MFPFGIWKVLEGGPTLAMKSFTLRPSQDRSCASKASVVAQPPIKSRTATNRIRFIVIPLPTAPGHYAAFPFEAPLLDITLRRCVIHPEDTQSAKVEHHLRYGSVRHRT